MTRAFVVVAMVALGGEAAAQPGMPPPEPAPPPLPTPPEVAPASPEELIAHAEAMPPRRVTFEQAVALALEHAADARIAADEVVRADALLAESASALRPLVGVSAQYQQLEGDRFSHGFETAAAESVLGELSVAMPVLDFRKRADTQRARDNLEVERASAATTRRSVAIATGRAYLSVFAAERIIEVAELARQTAKAHVDYATSRTRGGIGTELDIVRAQSELATDEQNLATAQTALVDAEEALGVLTGQSMPLGSTTEPAFPDAPDITGVAGRADLVAGRRRLSSAQWSRDAQWAEYAPTLSLNGIGFYDTPQIDPTPAWGFQILATIAVPLYDGGYRSGLAQERDAVLAESREELAQLERSASSEVRAGEDAVRRAREARDAAHRSADFATKALQLANVAYQGGTGTSLDVIDAERTARDAATEAVIADDGLRQAQFALLAATGHFPS
ncbi:MAG TPA: TolC family protein [Kofleriaceae bacterium]